MKNSGIHTEHSRKSPPIRLNQVKEKMEGLEIKVRELYHSIKGNFESKKKTQNKTSKHTESHIEQTQRTEKEETQAKATENIFKKKFKEEKHPNRRKEIPIKDQKAYRAPNRKD